MINVLPAPAKPSPDDAQHSTAVQLKVSPSASDGSLSPPEKDPEDSPKKASSFSNATHEGASPESSFSKWSNGSNSKSKRPPSLSPHSFSQSFKHTFMEELIDPEDIVGLEGDGLEGDLLGTGSFGEVRKVSWRRTPAAAKIAHAHISEAQKGLFIRELEVMARVRHPNIISFLGYVDTPFVIVMELCPLGDLKNYWKSHRMSVSLKVRVCNNVLCALGYLHNRKPDSIIHRDVKPTNVLMCDGGIAKLTDFGLGRMVVAGDPYELNRGRVRRNSSSNKCVIDAVKDADAAAAAATERSFNHTKAVGTERYMAPESGSGIYDEKLDIYSAGVTFYELFEQDSFDPTLKFAYVNTPLKIQRLVSRMGAPKPGDRPSALELIDLFNETKMGKSSGVLDPSSCCSVS